MNKKLYFRFEGDDYNVIMPLSGCYEWIMASCEEIVKENLFDTPEEDMPSYTITPVWMTEEEVNNLPEAD